MTQFFTKKNIVITAIIIIVALIIFSVPLFSKEIDYQPKYNTRGSELTGEQSAGQTFYSIDKRLHRISILLANFHNRPNDKDIVFRLREEGSDNDIRTVTINASQVKDNVFQDFTFEPIKDSFGKKYYFFIESPDSIPGNAITYRYNTVDEYPSGDLYINHEKQAGDLAFKASYKESPLVMWGQGFIKDPKKFLILLLFIVIAWVIYSLIFKQEETKQKEGKEGEE